MPESGGDRPVAAVSIYTAVVVYVDDPSDFYQHIYIYIIQLYMIICVCI